MEADYHKWYTEVDNKWTAGSDIANGRYSLCGDCGAVIPYSSRTQHNNFHKTFSNRRNDTMSNVTWCDPGNHAFKANAPGSIHFEGEQRDENGNGVFVTTDACAEHNPTAHPDVRTKAQLERLAREAGDELKQISAPPTHQEWHNGNFTD